MSADNGYIIRKNTSGKFCLQMYFDSSDAYPSVEECPDTMQFDTLDAAADRYEDMCEEAEAYGYPLSEYGLTINVKDKTNAT